MPLLFGVVRLIQVDFNRDYWYPIALDVSFALILGGLLVTLGWVFRSVAANVDETRARAVESYAAAAAADAAEQERIAVAALMHDSVLAALIAAERAHTPRERTLAVAMAREALTRLANTELDSEEGSDEPRDADSVAEDIERAALELGVRVTAHRSIEPTTPPMPGRIARALVLAATQAISNAAQHAGGSGLAVTVDGSADPAGVRITVRDTGAGFDLDRVPHDRLGIRASIFARVAAVGGHEFDRVRSGRHDRATGVAGRQRMISVRQIIVGLGLAFTAYLAARGLWWTAPVPEPLVVVATLVLYLVTTWLCIFWEQRRTDVPAAHGAAPARCPPHPAPPCLRGRACSPSPRRSSCRARSPWRSPPRIGPRRSPPGISAGSAPS